MVGKSSKGAAENQTVFFLRAALQNVESSEGSGVPQVQSGKHEIKTGRETALECFNYDPVQVLGHFPTICSLC